MKIIHHPPQIWEIRTGDSKSWSHLPAGVWWQVFEKGIWWWHFQAPQFDERAFSRCEWAGRQPQGANHQVFQPPRGWRRRWLVRMHEKHLPFCADVQSPMRHCGCMHIFQRGWLEGGNSCDIQTTLFTFVPRDLEVHKNFTLSAAAMWKVLPNMMRKSPWQLNPCFRYYYASLKEVVSVRRSVILQ